MHSAGAEARRALPTNGGAAPPAPLAARVSHQMTGHPAKGHMSRGICGTHGTHETHGTGPLRSLPQPFYPPALRRDTVTSGAPLAV